MKHQKSYSFFCCYCEEPRKRERDNQINKPRQELSQIYKIDTNSNFSEKMVPPVLNDKKVEKEKEKEKENNNYILENNKSIDSYHTINNKNKNNKILKKEDNNNIRNFHKNFLQSDINSFLAKKERNNIKVENLSAYLKNYKTNNSINNNIIQKEKPEEKEEQKNEDINKDKKNTENLQNLFIINNDKCNDENKTCNNKINNLNSNQSLIKVDEKENVISQTVRRVNKFELDDKISQEQLLWKNKSKNSNIVNNDLNLIKNNNIIDISHNNNISNKSIQNETKNEKDTNPINKIEMNIDNDITCEKEKEKEEIIPKENEIESELTYKKIEKENKTLQHKKIAKLSVNNINNNNSFNSDFEIKANINNKEMNLINKNLKIKNEDNQNPKENLIKNEETENKQLNELNNTETQQEIADKTDVFDSQSLSQNGNNLNNISIKEGINVKLNYLTEFDPVKTNQEENKETETKKSKSKKESVSEEIEDEVGSIDEFNNSNDNRSILTSYIFSSVRPTESNKSYASSVYGRSESQDLISNYNELMSNKGMRIFPVDMNNNNNKEVEIRMDNLYRNSKNYFLAMQMNQMKKLKEKIADKEKIINNNYNSIEKLKNKMEKMEEEGRQYERWIEKEEEENENLVYLLNFLIECK